MNKNDKPNYNEIFFTNVQVEDIINSYLNGESSVSIGKRYNISHKPILKLFLSQWHYKKFALHKAKRF